MMFRLNFQTEKCVACNACVIACIDQNDTQTERGERPNRRFLEYESKSLKTAKTVSCVHCANARCIEACSKGCIRRDGETGFVIFDDKDCTGCGICMDACPFNAIHLNPELKIRKCDGCNERVKHNLYPACIGSCPTHALTLVEC